MTTEDIIIQIFYAVDHAMLKVRKVPQAKLYPSEVVTIGILFALKRRTLSGLLPLAKTRL